MTWDKVLAFLSTNWRPLLEVATAVLLLVFALGLLCLLTEEVIIPALRSWARHRVLRKTKLVDLSWGQREEFLQDYWKRQGYPAKMSYSLTASVADHHVTTSSRTRRLWKRATSGLRRS